MAGDSFDPRGRSPVRGSRPSATGTPAATRTRALTSATRRARAGFFGIVGLVIFFRADQSWLFIVTQAVILATIYLSITVITGFAGQISLCQGAFVAIGGFTVFQLVDRYGMSVLVAAFIGAGAAAACGRCCRCRCCASAACGSRSRPWPSRSSSTP